MPFARPNTPPRILSSPLNAGLPFFSASNNLASRKIASLIKKNKTKVDIAITNILAALFASVWTKSVLLV